MAQKGVNTLIRETKENIAKAVNEGLTNGLPIGVIETMLDAIMLEVRMALDTALQQEKERYESESDVEKEQIEYTGEPIKEGE